MFLGKQDYNSSVYSITGSLELYVGSLHHYTDYMIWIQACREKIEGNNRPECSTPAKVTHKTLKKGKALSRRSMQSIRCVILLSDDADIITSGISVFHKNQTSVTLTWDPPAFPNGNILYYLIEYKRLDIENVRTYKSFYFNDRFFLLLFKICSPTINASITMNSRRRNIYTHCTA